ncbi:MAG: transcription-repair coupling factor [Rickettsiales bacterium]|jgi:transcription-repair coupling factor (superfamily II helicase)|nr:transcription-repair coupling factor [Rickettsiales bacterium]
MTIQILENDFLNTNIDGSDFSKSITRVIREQNSIRKNDLVIHIKYGLGKFVGLETVNFNGVYNDFIKLEYADSVFLLIPVENFDLITKYGDHSDSLKLDRLNSGSWSERKHKIREKLRDLAENLIKIASERKIKQGQIFTVNSGEYEDFCGEFPFEATVDQLRATDDVINDLSSGILMDRLICGDVGFGKTEVAIRASFVVVNNKYKAQVAVIVPTTILCRQHHKQFQERFKNTNVKIASLSRFSAQNEVNKIRKDLENGEIDIVVGTHSLLGKSIKFRNLGLVIVDEEQRFGVAQKEKLKEMGKNTHILSMSATPIPRTLQMSMGGLKDLSLITTPPLNRINVETVLCKYDDIEVKKIMEKEIERDGKIFFVVPRIVDIREVENRLNKFMPNLKYCIAHGQMKNDEIDLIINDFYDGKYNVLISTTIVESGIDIPTANTMIIYRANNFGLAQLYQLRGRVGRSSRQAFAYLTLKETEEISDTAQKRLNIIESIKNLNSGFVISSEDMDIRGAGNILGDAQSGHIREVGIELYNQMLRDAIKSKKGNFTVDEVENYEFSPEIKLNISTIIPTEYIGNINVKMKYYKEIAGADGDEEILEIKNKLKREYGTLPNSVENLLKISPIKNRCRWLNIHKLTTVDNGLMVSFYKNKFAGADGLLDYIFTKKIFKLRKENIFYECTGSDIFDDVEKLLGIFEKIIG